jgi:hypothetical protein
MQQAQDAGMKTGVSVLGEKTFFLKDKTVAIEVKVG